MNPLLSFIVATARESVGSIIGQPDWHLLEPTLKSLAAQRSQNFELVVVDSLFRQRTLAEEIDALGKWPFPWRVATPDSWWLEQGMWALQNAFNRGYQASTGRYLYFCGDCCEFPAHTTLLAQSLIEAGFSPHLLYVYKMSDRLRVNGERHFQTSPWSSVPEALCAGADFRRHVSCDSRWPYTDDLGGFCPPARIGWNSIHGYACVKREDFAHVNGFDENFDGDKSLGDIELGSRLHLAGRWTGCLSTSLYVYEHHHERISERVFPNCQTLPPVRSNYDLIHLMREREVWRANSTQWSEEDCQRVICAEITALPDWPHRRGQNDERSLPYQRHWIEHQPVFDLG